MLKVEGELLKCKTAIKKCKTFFDTIKTSYRVYCSHSLHFFSISYILIVQSLLLHFLKHGVQTADSAFCHQTSDVSHL